MDSLMETDGGGGPTPHHVLAAGWVPFTICTVFCLIFSTLYILWYRSVRSGEHSKLATTASIFSLFFTLLSAFLVPVDVFLVSFMKFSNGTYKPWAADSEVREDIQWTVLQAYYAIYGIILVFAFLILPFSFFFYALRGDDSGDEAEAETTGKKFCRALKFTLVSLFTFGLIVILGIFIPFDGTPPGNTTKLEKLDYIVHEFESSHGDNLIVFIMNIVNIIGMFLIIIYMAYGMTSLPLGMIRRKNSLHVQRASVEEEMKELEEQVNQIKNRYIESDIPQFETQQMERLERRIRLLQRSQHDLNQRAKTFVNRCIGCCRPFQVIVGIFFGLFGFLIFISLLLTSIDKAMHSLGPRSGYILQNSTIPNPIDFVLVYAQEIFPLDYILYTAIILFLVFCSVSGVKNLGIRFMWLSVYKIKAHSTKPQALVMMCLNLIFIMMALSVIMFSVIPGYTTYGSQHYVVNITYDDVPVNVETNLVKRCNDVLTPPDDCNITRIALLLLAFHSKAWIFGAAYFWLVWIFLAMIVVSSIVCMFKHRRRAVAQEEDDLDELLDDSNPFNQAEA